MRLAFVMNPAGGIGGAESNVLDFLRAVDVGQVECAVVTLQGPNRFNAQLNTAGVYNPVATGSPAAQLRCLAAFLHQWRPDVLHLFGLKANLFGRLLGRPAGCAVVSAIVGANPTRPRHHVTLDRSTAPLVDRWIANSQAGKLVESRRTGIPHHKISVIYGGVDPEHYAPPEDRGAAKERLGISPSTRVIVTVANLRPMKGHSLIVQAVQGIVDRVGDTVFLFVGEDSMGGAIPEEARERGVDHHLRFLGGQADVRPYLAAADAFVLPSTHEGLPTSILEAMSMQLPVIASRVGGIPEMLEHRETGFLVQPGDVGGLEAAVVDVLTDASLRDRLGSNARRRVLEQFSLDRMVMDLMREYRRMAQLHAYRRRA